MNDTVHSSHLANHHVQKGLTCSSCHGNDLIPDANATSINARHDLSRRNGTGRGESRTLPKSPRVSPRQYRLRLLSFRASESKAYCQNCHTNFDMPMLGRTTAAKAKDATPAAEGQSRNGYCGGHDMKRRDVLKLVAASAVTKPSVVLAAASQNTKADIVVIGAGGAGCSAAVTARCRGKVIVLENADHGRQYSDRIGRHECGRDKASDSARYQGQLGDDA
jgi:hypothetical protein